MTALGTRVRQRIAAMGDDRGTSLLELLVGMALMSIFMAIFTAALISMFAATNKIQAIDNSSGQLNTAFDRLDKQVRYATAIDAPIAPTVAIPYWSVAFASVDPTMTTTCTQLRIGTALQNQLKQRTWTVTVNADGSTSAANVSGWSQLASGVTNGAVVSGSTDQPFTLPTSAGVTLQQLHLRLIASDGTGQATTSVSEITFTALNSVANLTALANGSSVSACAPAPALGS